MALQRINQELEDKLYRMVRATTQCPVAPSSETVMGSRRPSCYPLALVES